MDKKYKYTFIYCEYGTKKIFYILFRYYNSDTIFNRPSVICTTFGICIGAVLFNKQFKKLPDG